MKNGIYEIVSNRPIALDTYEMVLAGDMGFVENPGAVCQHPAGRAVPAPAHQHLRLG